MAAPGGGQEGVKALEGGGGGPGQKECPLAIRKPGGEGMLKGPAQPPALASGGRRINSVGWLFCFLPAQLSSVSALLEGWVWWA